MKKVIQVGVGVAITVACLYYVFRGMDWAQFFDALRRANWLYAVPMVGITMLSFYWRAIRWRVLLLPKFDIPSRRLFGPVMIGFGFNNIFPLRAGELARPYALAKQDGVPFATGLSTVVLERLVDALVLLLLLVLMPYFAPIGGDIPPVEFGGHSITLEFLLQKLSILAAIMGLGILSFLVPPLQRLYIAILHALPLLPATLKEKLEHFILSFAQGFECLKDPVALLLTVVHTAVIWATVAASFWVMSLGFPGVSLGVGTSLGFLVLTCVAVSLPSSPGFWGPYEIGGKIALVAMGVVPNSADGASLAVAFTMVVHALQWVSLSAVGLYYGFKLGVGAGDAAEAKT